VTAWSDVEQGVKPEGFITATGVIDGVEVCSDKVKWLVVQEPSFLHRLRFDKGSLSSQHLRCLLAAKGVYGREDLKKFCLQLLSYQEIIDLGLPVHVAAALTSGIQIPGFSDPGGFKAAMYRDFVSQRYIVAFAGTELTDFEDILENIWQANILQNEQPFTPQYTEAMRIADEIRKLQGRKVTLQGKLIPQAEAKDDDPLLEFIFTGHSLGGGLASAASVVSGMRAVTFNAAGLHENTLNNASPDSQQGALVRFSDNGAGLIRTIYTDHDILTQLQDLFHHHSLPIPKAIGVRHHPPLAGGYGTNARLGNIARSIPNPLAIVLGIALSAHAAYKSHGTDALLHGFLAEDNLLN
jgi:hypothetical protein